MSGLLIFSFVTGDESCKFYDVPVIVYGDNKDIDSIEDSFASYLDSDASEDSSYEEAVADVMDASGLKWEMAYGKIPSCDFWRIMRL